MKTNIFLNYKLKRYNNKEEYLIDTQLRSFLLEILEHIENSLKQNFINEVGENYDNIDFYRETFKYEVEIFIKEKTNSLIKKDDECKNFNKKIEVNIFISKLTFGEFLHLLRKLNVKNKRNINGFYGFKKIIIFEDWINNIRYLRNLVCHGENILNRVFLKRILIFNDEFKINSFIGYLAILSIFSKILGIDYKIEKIINFLKNKKNVPGVKHISKEIEAWYVLVDSLYDFYVKKSNLNLSKIKNMKNKKTILITGGTGYIGSHGVVAFEEAGYKTVIVDNLSNSSLESLDGIEKIIGYKPDFYNIDLRTSPQPSPLRGEGVYSLEEVFKKYNFDGVIHFAGLKAVGESCEKPELYFDNNINGSNNLFGLMNKYQVKNIVFSSSATVYTSENKSPLDEEMQTGNCSNPYGTTKFLIENILKDLSKFSGFKVMNLRYFNPIGCHKSGFIGENPKGIPNNLLPFIMKVATGELKELKVFGGDYNTIDGTGVRDYIDVVDLIDGHLKAYEKINSPFNFSLQEGNSKEGKFEIYNLGVGSGISVLEMVKKSEEIIGKKINYSIVERRSGDLAEVYCNPDKAFKELGWKSKISLEESLENSWRFYNK